MASVNCRVKYKSDRKFDICRAQESKVDQGGPEYVSTESRAELGTKSREQQRRETRAEYS